MIHQYAADIGTFYFTYDRANRHNVCTGTDGYLLEIRYDEKGRITGYSNKDGSTVGYTYDANGNRLTVTDELGNVTSYTYDANNRLTSVTDALNHTTTYAYDKVGNLISTTDALGNVTSQTYDHLGNLTSQTDALGNETVYAYDKLGRCVSITDPKGGVTAAQYDAAGNIVKITDPEGNVTTYAYDANNRLTSYTDAEGHTFSYTYDGNGNVLTYTDGNGNVTTYTYDGLDRAIARTNADNNVATNEYDAAGRLIKAVNEEGAVTTYAYDADDRLLSMTDALGHVTSFEYDTMDRVTKVTDALGNETTYAYDALGRITTVTNAKGVATTYTYDALGNILTATDAAGTVSYAYDALGRVTSVTDRNGNTQSFAYDSKGQITKVTDKNGNETAYTYDPNGNIIKTTDALGTEVLFEYNANDQLTKMTQNRVDSFHEQAEQLITLYQYDGRNLVTKVVRSSGDEELYTYDGNGNMLTKTDADGYVTEYSYNSLDLVSHINYNDAKEVSYQYNKVGELVKMDDWLGTTTFEVDLLGQLKKVTDHKGNVVEYAYDAVGNQTSVTYPDETTVTKTYDNTYNLTKVTDAENQNYLYQYDDAGRVTKLTYPNGWVEDYTYDAEGNLLKTVDTDPFHNNRKSTKYEYRYDAEGNLVSEYKRDTTAANKALTTTYTYDALNRLTASHEEGVGVNTTRTYQYDGLGNMIREEQDGCVEYRYNGYSLDESTECGVIPGVIGTCRWEYTYDGRGNLISNDKYTRTTTGMDWQNVETYVYDETNHMVQGTNELGEVSLYTYNGLGIRVGREFILKDNTHGYTDFHSQTPSVETGIDKPEVVKESYVIDYTSATYNTLVMDEEGGFNYRWPYGLERLNVKITSEGTNWWGQHVTTDILKDYLHQDRLGSTTNLTDTFGRVVGRADYNEWGEMTYREALSITSSYRRIYPQSNYTGHDWDDVLSMYYAKARFYDPDAKRFVAMDPIKGSITEPLSLVSYLYCVDNPLRWVDPLGLFLVGTVLREGAKGFDVALVHAHLMQAGYIDVMNIDWIDNNPLRYSKMTADAVKLFQKDHHLPQTGKVDYPTWTAMGFSVNNTLEEEFWSGKKGNDLISVTLEGNTITIDYFPKIYICEEKLMTNLQYDGQEFTDFYEFNLSEAQYKAYEQRIVAGIKQWAKESVNIQGVDAKVIVNVTPTRTQYRHDADIVYVTAKEIGNITPAALIWSTNISPTIYLEGIGIKDEYWNGKDMVANITSHEFGHVLGIWDAYGYGNHFAPLEFPFPAAPSSIMIQQDKHHSKTAGIDQITTDSVMYSDWGIDFKYEPLLYEMMLYAWKQDQLQVFTPILGHPSPSQALYR